ncbi:MAG: type II toxin-antitoxin system VapC family toxin [Trueperaceae bacterium]|nr:type II toxin-antitoxin system VapC family toxin [Trueperaceae bacterium]
MFVLDTNSVIHFFKSKGRVAERLMATPPSEVGVPAIVVYELEAGIRKRSGATKRAHQLASLLAHVKVVPFGKAEAVAAAEIRAALETTGTPIGPMDTLIAGTALANSAILVTGNLREFERVPGLRVANWFD